MNIRDKQVPCFGCRHRTWDCHSKCTDYMEYYIKNRENDVEKMKDEFYEYKKIVIGKAVKKKRNSLINK